MSFTKADILARLQNGDTVDAIAQEMANALNEAEAEKRALDAAKEKEETKVINAKRAAVDDMLDALCDYFAAAGEDDLLDEIHNIEVDKIIELLDGSIEMAKRLEKLKDLQFVTTPKAKITVAPADLEGADQVIGEFLKQFGL
jgi:phage tail protein X